jgi:hypothetical protein
MGIIHLPRACRNNASAHGPVGSVVRVHFVATAIHPHASRCAHVTSTAAPSAHPHKDHAPFAMSSSHRASGTRAGSAAHGSRGRPSWRMSVSCSVRKAVGGQSRAARRGAPCDSHRSCRADVPCHCEEWRCIGGGVRVQWVVWCVCRSSRMSNDAGGSRAPRRLNSLQPPQLSRLPQARASPAARDIVAFMA